MKKIIVLTFAAVSLFFVNVQVFASVASVKNLKIATTSSWFTLSWDRVQTLDWQDIDLYEVLMATYPVTEVDYYEEWEEVQYSQDWVEVTSFWSQSFIKGQNYYFSVIAIDPDWNKSNSYSNEVRAAYTWENSPLDSTPTEFNDTVSYLDTSSFSEINTADLGDSWNSPVEWDMWTWPVTNTWAANPELLNNTWSTLETSWTWSVWALEDVVDDVNEILADMWTWSNMWDAFWTGTLKWAAEAEDKTAPEDIKNFKAWYKRVNWNNYKVDLDWQASENSQWDLDHQNLYQKSSKTEFSAPEKLAKDVVHVEKNMVWGDEYSFKVTTVDANNNESTWVLAAINLPLYLPQTWLPIVITGLVSLLWAGIYRRRKDLF